jgi:hypothetical protein
VAEQERNIDALMVPRVGRVEEVPGGVVPYRLVDAFGVEMAAVSEFLLDLPASDCSRATLRSYAYELLGLTTASTSPVRAEAPGPSSRALAHTGLPPWAPAR